MSKPPSKFHAGQYRNGEVLPRDGTLKKLRIGFKYLLRKKPVFTRPQGAVPVLPLTRDELLAAPADSLWRLGHSTILLKLGERFYLTDPVFSERASPVQWAGPLRFHQPPLTIAQLPPIEAVILSHNHYDHLDHASILALEAKTRHFLCPLGVGQTLQRWGVPQDKIRELDWWQETELDDVLLAATPSQHFSGRTLRDSNATLWVSWVIRSPNLNLFFSGDSGYFPGFKLIGDHYGPFDVTFMETGAYNRNWPKVHMHPPESLQAHLDVRGRWLLPIHNGTFDLSMHPWHEPFERIIGLAHDAGVPVATPRMGERLSLLAPEAGQMWWRTVDPDATGIEGEGEPSVR